MTLADLGRLDGDVVYFAARAEGGGMSTAVSVETLHGDGLETFAAGLESDFRGWPGERVWKSFRGDLELHATHGGRSVELAWTLHGLEPAGGGARPWSCTVRTFVTPGEELRRFSADVAGFLAT
ncbi:DUF6228 family protein [Amycolatopsis sp. NPDC101161]|uniref:DUF6228 family protein n=1 Tax=Amycolatopsis sp. NPDC101161 TaxID=3363940 RepID=UPI0037FD93A8